MVTVDGVVTAAVGGVAAAVGKEMWSIISSYGRPFVLYYLNSDEDDIKKVVQTLEADHSNRVPPFMIIGLGRCGSHVTGTLAEIVAISSEKLRIKEQGAQGSPISPPQVSVVMQVQSNLYALLKKIKSKISGIENDGEILAVVNPSVLSIEPIMIIGDADEKTFPSVRKLLENTAGNVEKRLLQVDYSALAKQGVGNTPIFSEFLTRCLLTVGPSTDSDEADRERWKKARTFVIDGYSGLQDKLRLVFYVFSASGGTGSGAAAELMRAQRSALIRSGNANPQIYFGGVVVIPKQSMLKLSQTHLRNVGRLFVKYLADFNIRLESLRHLNAQPYFRYSTFLIQGDEKPSLRSAVKPWNSLAVVSNDVMNSLTVSSSSANYDDADMIANYYVAQQMFNLSSSQLDIADRFSLEFSRSSFNSVSLDTNDLNLGLIGPYATCFAAFHPDDIAKDVHWVERMIINAISPPHIHTSIKTGGDVIVEGVSILPTRDSEYSKTCDQIREGLTGKEDTNTTRSSFYQRLREFTKFDFFRQCPRVIIVITAPKAGMFPADLANRIEDACGALFPNLIQARVAVIRGTTDYYTISIFVEGSVLLVPDIEHAIRSYIWFSWAKPNLAVDAFDTSYKELMGSEFPLVGEDKKFLGDWVGGMDQLIGEEEDFSIITPRFEELAIEWNDVWDRYIEKHKGDFTSDDIKLLRSQQVADHLVTREQVIAALRYVLYVKRFRKIANPSD